MNACPYVPVDKEKEVGIDSGLKHFLVNSNGKKKMLPGTKLV
jgi:putative transposase